MNYNDSKGIYLMYLRKSRADEYNQDVENILKRHEEDLQSLAKREFGELIPEKYIFREVGSLLKRSRGSIPHFSIYPLRES